MLSKATFIAATAVALLAGAGMAAAAPMACSTRTDFLAKLATKYHEQPSSIALTSDGQLLEVTKSSDGATWSMLITTPKGISCLIATGDNWLDKSNEKSSPQL